MSETIHLSFSIGPVQGFVAQARRTRDLWAGSWLLSYLAECALVAAEQAGGRAVIPHRPKDQRGKLTSIQTAIGGIPNRFEVAFTGDDAHDQAAAAARAAEQALQKAWRRVADAVWNRFVEPVAPLGNGTRDIWERQVGGFWEVAWVVGTPDDSGTIGHLAAMRKNFRNIRTAEEPGTKCALMPALQELSGYAGNRRSDRDRQQEFWTAFRNQPTVSDLNLGDTERLCAIALIKRLFPSPQVMRQAVGEDIGTELDQVSWPSTAFLSALPWLKSLSGEARAAAEQYQQQARQAGYHESERFAARDAGISWAGLDGPVWFATAVRNDEPGGEQLGPKPSDDQKRARRQQVDRLLTQLRSLQETTESRPVPYYALLLMDGDSMGELVRQIGDPSEVSRCLNQFAGQVKDVVKESDGRTVYAGGDDVLALVPAIHALPTAEKLCDRYRAAFDDLVKKGQLQKNTATISAAIVYAHWRYPLRQVLHTAHELLDDFAKDRTGRDSVALGVVLGSGLNAVWSVPWAVLRGEADGSARFMTLVEEHFGSSPDSEQAEFNASFLYLLRERFGRLFDDLADRPGTYASVPEDLATSESSLLRDLAHAEYRRRLSAKEQKAQKKEGTEPLIDQLMSLSLRWRRTGPGQVESEPDTFAFDGWRVARFIRQILDGKADDHD